MFQHGVVITLRNIARSDNTVTTAVPAIVLQDSNNLLATYIPQGTRFKNNWVVAPEKRVASVDNIIPSGQRIYRDLAWWHNTIRLYLSGKAFSVWLNFTEQGKFSSWYGNLEAPFVRTRLGIDTRDFGLDIVAYRGEAGKNGRYAWKDEAEFARRLEVGLDSTEHQARVWAAGHEFIERFEQNRWPFNLGWERWRPNKSWPLPRLPADWAIDLGTGRLLD